jgi:hypothetical protein
MLTRSLADSHINEMLRVAGCGAPVFCVWFIPTTSYAREDEQAWMRESAVPLSNAPFPLPFFVFSVGLFNGSRSPNFPARRTTLLATIRICIIISYQLKSTIWILWDSVHVYCSGNEDYWLLQNFELTFWIGASPQNCHLPCFFVVALWPISIHNHTITAAR